ncbi:TetR/AcrR family transcriptional regulator [Nocardioides sp. LMS-CY]|uniref:TetR/AcrR family transcriptional regulator n=1 Tax=Nocardioides sp. (strain LMS-CY) TaxID=2840457 RepID=UPI001C00567D|nr:TetR/AcrR family transcriptional regulator [Nocardioides sp. LMS-CY]QWF20808.1 TetR/AcrR family transcriptional regulator [Nocardioides sp. LMS-CY]
MVRVGRPSGPAEATTEVVLRAALTLLLEEGGAALTPQRLHQLTSVSRATIYRHWPTPTDVLAALIDVAPDPERPLTGDPVRDVHAEVDALCDRLHEKPVATFLQALVAMAATDPAAVELRQRYVDGLIAPFYRALSGADLPPTEAKDAVAAIVSPLLVDALLLDRPAARVRAHRVVDLHVRPSSARQEADPASSHGRPGRE